MKQGYVYILTNKNKTVLYTGITSDLMTRISQYRNKLTSSFAKKYNCQFLVYYEIIDCIDSAILREKQIKASRAKKLELINRMNPDWKDLYYSLVV